MKRKIYSILTLVFMLFACVFGSACGDKYKDLEFKITYAFSEDSDEWYDATYGISLNYETVDGKMVFKIDEDTEYSFNPGELNLYFNVDILNVDEKHIDRITVSATDSVGLAFSTATVKENEVFKVPVSGLVNSSLSFYDNNSGKSTKIGATIYKTLEEVVLNEEIKPAVVIGNSVDLKLYGGLLQYKPFSETNQTGVTYEISNVGRFLGGEFVADAERYKSFLTLNNGVLSVADKINLTGREEVYDLRASNNVVQIKATSVYNSEKTAFVYVYLMENNLVSPEITFSSNGINVNDEDLADKKGIDLYYNEIEDTVNYAKSEVIVSDVAGIYKNGIVASDGTSLAFETVVYVDGVKYDLESSEELNGLVISKSTEGFVITTTKNLSTYKNILTFGYEIDGVSFVSNKPVLTTDVEVRKHVLAGSITINNEDFVNGSETYGTVYSVSNTDHYNGYEVKISIDPKDVYAGKQYVELSGINVADLIITNKFGSKYNSGDQIVVGETLYAKFKDGVVGTKQITFTTPRTPTFYNGESVREPLYITVKLNLEKKVTADSLEFGNYDVDTHEFTKTLDNYVAANQASYVYVKASYKGNLRPETLKIISDNENVKFANGMQEMTFDNNLCQAVYSDIGYSIYKIPVLATNGEYQAKFDVVAGDGKVGVSETSYIESVYLLNDVNKLQVVSKDELNAIECGESTNRYAIAKGTTVAFEVLDGNNNYNTIKEIKLSSVSLEGVDGFSLDAVRYSVIPTNQFRVKGNIENTQILNVIVSYYGIDKNNTIQEKTTTIENVQFAVYKPISGIDVEIERDAETGSVKNKIVYVNERFLDAAYTQITYGSRASDSLNPSEIIKFYDWSTHDVVEINSAAQVQISIDKDFTEEESLQISYKNKTQSNFGSVIDLTKLTNNVLLENAADGGVLKLQLVEEISRYNDVSITFIAKRFGKVSNVLANAKINFVDVERAIDIEVKSGDIVEHSQTNKELQLSFMDSETNLVSKQFEVAPIYTKVTQDADTLRFNKFSYKLYKYTIENGEIVYEVVDGVKQPALLHSNALIVTIKDGVVTVIADKNNETVGGLYKLELATEDNYDDVTGTYTNTWAINVRVSDGKENSEYIISSKEDFLKIGRNVTNLSAHYVLGDNIELGDLEKPIGYIGTTVNAFKGSLKGNLQTVAEDGSLNVSTYNVYVTLKNGVQSSDETAGNPQLYGLFAINEGKITNINLHVTYLIEREATETNPSRIGGLTAINKGHISNVNLYIGGDILSYPKTDFGGIAALNFKDASIVGVIENCYVDSSVDAEGVEISTCSDSNIGLIAGVNKGLITGKYLGKESLESVSYDVIANLKVKHLDFVAEYNIGAVVGYSENKISNILVGGQIAVTITQGVANGFAAGIVGKTIADLETVASLGLNITAETGVDALKVAGIAGYSDGLINQARFIAASVKFNFSANYCFGKLMGNDVVAGISAEGNGDITYSTVESFVDKIIDKEDNSETIFYIMEGKTVYGITGGNGTIANSFVSANLSATNSLYLTSNGTNDKTYFIGRTNIASPTTNSTYSVVYDNDSFVYVRPNAIDVNDVPTKLVDVYEESGKTISSFFREITKEEAQIKIDALETVYALNAANKYEIVATAEEDKVYFIRNAEALTDLFKKVAESYEAITDETVLTTEEYSSKLYTKQEVEEFDIDTWKTLFTGLTGFKLNENYNIINVADYAGINLFFPYIEESTDNPLMIIAPNSISAELNSNYQISTEKNVYINNVDEDHINNTYKISETIIVDFFKNNNDNYSEINEHYLINGTIVNGEEQKGLINLDILPADSPSGLRFEIIGNGRDYAYITPDNKIVFTGASNNNAIIIRCYSIFNVEVEVYVAVYSQFTFSKLTLNSGNIQVSEENNIDYQLNVYAGQTGNLISFGAENKIEGNNYSTIFENSNISEYLYVVATSNKGASSQLKLTTDLYSSLSVTTIDNAEFANGDYELVTFALYLKSEYFGVDYITDDYLIGDLVVEVNLYNVANSLMISGANGFEFATNSELNLKVSLTTGYVDGVEIERQENVKVENGIIEVGSALDSRDSIFFSFEEVSGAEQINKLKTINGVDHVEDLFDYDVYSTLAKDESKNPIGYNYQLFIELKNSRSYRYITEPIQLELVIWARTDNTISSSVTITINPTTASTARIANYAVEKIEVVTNNVNALTAGKVETSIISPGGAGNIMLLYVEQPYSKIDKVTIKSSTINVPSIGGNVMLMFTQLVYNVDKGRFETVYSSTVHAQQGDTLELNPITTIDNNGKTEYTGVMYVHAQIVEFSGLEAVITATLNVVSNGKTLEPYTQSLITEYLPGASLIYSGTQIGNTEKTYGYLIQEDTYGNVAKIKLYGYQFNANPTLYLNWEIIDGSNYFYNINGTENKTIAIERDLLEAFKDNNLYYKAKDNMFYKAKSDSVIYDWLNGEDSAVAVEFYSITDRKTIYENGDTSNEALKVANYVSLYLKSDDDEVIYNAADGSYTMEVVFNVASNVPAAFTMDASLSLITKDGHLETANSNVLLFYPTQFVLESVSVANTSGNRKMLAINRTDKLELIFNTNRTDVDYSEAIYEELINQVGVAKLAEYYSYVNNEKILFSDPESKHEEFVIGYAGKYLTITGQSTFNNVVTFAINSGYKLVNGKYQLTFADNVENLTAWEYSFALQIYPSASEENAIPLYSVEDMFNSDGSTRLAENGHYILMNDITVDVVKPIEFDNGGSIASFDGNNKVITIKSFAVDTEKTEYGLFANFGTYQDEEGNSKKAILKNVIVDYSKFTGTTDAEENGAIELVNNDIKNVVFGGLVATNNGGLIYNCDVMNLSLSRKTISLLVDDDASVVFGGLVGNNTGIITNSRVGRSSYLKIDAKKDTYSKEVASGLSFVLGNDSTTKFDSVAAGLVAKNSGEISSSYFANSDLINYSSSVEVNKTAGFVAENANGARIMYSYVKALESTITSENPYSTGAKIEGKSNGIVAGFVYENKGSISDSYANTELVTNSAYMAGFVYNNETSGVISESYAACTMNSNLESGRDNAEQPFVGKDNQNKYLSNGELTNTYYLLATNEVEDTVTDPVEKSKPMAKGLNATNFSNANNLIGFVFIESNIKAEREEGVWSYTDINNQSRILPELMNANIIAHSSKYLIAGNGLDEKFTYTNAASFAEGSKNNPFIVRSVAEYNDVFTAGRTSMSTPISKAGYVRLIDNINFGEDETAIKTRVNFTLGDAVSKSNITSVEGNGMTISGIYFDVSEPGIESIGLFANIANAYVKNFNLEFVAPKSGNQYSTTSVKYSGGLAGTIKNSAIINVSLDGKSVTLTGQNMVGGLAGLITGDSLLYGIRTNLSVDATNKGTALYYNEIDYKNLNKENYSVYTSNLSYAGGLAGVMDLTTRAHTQYNVSFIDIHGDEMTQKTSSGTQSANISAQYAGGVAGYASKNTNALKLRYYVGETDLISGEIAAGGLYAVSLGAITASQVTAEESEQFEYDTSLGKYIMNLKNNADASIDYTKSGNLNLIESSNYAGGLIGVGVSANIIASYSKAGIKDAKIAGGLVGVSLASGISYSYAVPFVQITDKLVQAGGLIGSAHTIFKDRNMPENANFKEYEDLAKLYKNRDANSKTKTDTDLQYAFATILVDNKELKNNETKIAAKGLTIDYIAANGNPGVLTSSGNSVLTNVFVGFANYAEGLVNNIASERSQKRYLDVLYDRENNISVQETLFQEIFSPWSTIPHWSLKSEKYFPLLLSDGVENYIRIEKADDFKLLISNPRGSFIVVNDIDMTGWKTTSNWVFNCGEEGFSGVLIGEMDVDTTTRKKVSGLKVTPTTLGDSSGLFNKTQGAVIRDIEFEWQGAERGAIDLTKVSHLSEVSGLSCYDIPDEEGTGSLFSNIEVRVVDKGGHDYLVNSDKPIQNFAGLIANTESSNIRNCNFIGKANVRLEKTGEDVYFGGLVGVATHQPQNNKPTPGEEDEEETIASSMTIMNSVVGADGTDPNKKPSVFTITVGNSKSANIGGAVGKISAGAIYGTMVGGVNNIEGYQNVEMTITIEEIVEEAKVKGSANYIGGLLGIGLQDSSVTYSEAATNITLKNGLNNKNINDVGGLVGYFDKGDFNNIANNATYTNIDIVNFKVNALNISTGVGKLNVQDSDIAIYQCLFNGGIISEGVDGEGNSITTGILNLNAGGAVAYASGTGSINIQEVMSTADIQIGSSETEKLSVGGIIGKAEKVNVYIENTATTGKIVPMCSVKATEVYVGGILGCLTNEDENGALAEKYLELYNTYSTSSIIADKIDGEALSIAYIDASIGYISKSELDGHGVDVTVENLFLSTDMSLATDDNQYTTNISVFDFLFGVNDVWRTKLTHNNGAWKTLEDQDDGYHRLPYLSGILDFLKKYKVIVDGDYIIGTSLKPIVINTSPYTLSENFNYYILNAENCEVKGVLNGVLIGHDNSNINFVSFNESANKGYKGYIEEVSDHSAVSNLHINLTDKTEYSIEGLVNGFIVGLNQGVMFNCSVSGTGITLTTGGGSSIGIIAGENNGLISHCYSSVEIINTKVDVAGIVYKNNAKLSTCYFTGYINNTSAAAGIMCEVDNTKLAYVYNCYMAGVIENVSENGSSFYSGGKFVNVTETGNASDPYIYNIQVKGKNNFVDSFANLEIVNEFYINNNGTEVDKNDGFNVSVLQTTSSAYLMSAKVLNGNWYHVVQEDGSVAKGGEHNKPYETLGFGRNYNYPIYNFNKGKVSDAEGAISKDLQYSLETGTGETTGDLEGRYNGITESSDVFKIPHLGVLSMVQGILDMSRNYVVIYDINVPSDFWQSETNLELGMYKSWTAVGTNATTEQGFKYSNGFNGLFVTRENFNLYQIKEEIEEPTEPVVEEPSEPVVEELKFTIRTIEGLKGNGLFGNIHNAYFRDINLGSFYELTASGALGTNVDKSEVAAVAEIGESSDVYVINIAFNEDSIVSGATTEVGGLFGNIQNGIVEVTSFRTFESKVTLKITEASAAGLISARMGKDGTINLTAEAESDNKLYPNFVNVEYAGGLVGIAAGTINANKNEIMLDLNVNDAGKGVTDRNIGMLGGVVGKTYNGTCTINGAIVNLYNTMQPSLNVNGFGGFVGETSASETVAETTVAAGTLNVAASEIKAGKNTINISSKNIGSFYGLLVGKAYSNVVVDFTLKNIKEINISATTAQTTNDDTNNIDTQAVGVLVGYQSANIQVTSDLSGVGLTIRVDKIANLGGVSGYYAGGTVAINKDSKEYFSALTLEGRENVGGLFGYSVAVLNENMFKLNPDDDASEEGINFLDYAGNASSGEGSESGGEVAMASSEPAGGSGETPESGSGSSEGFVKILISKYSSANGNFGGLFGVLASASTELAIVNVNTIEFSEEVKDTIKNIGGVAGLITGLVDNLSNKADIVAKADSYGGKIYNIGGIAGEFRGEYAGYKLKEDGSEYEPGKGLSNEGAITIAGLDADYIKNAENGENEIEGGVIKEYGKWQNVGGIFGLVNNEDNPVELAKLKNSAQVSGYQNVGGLIGYAKHVVIYGEITEVLTFANGGDVELDDNGNAVLQTDVGEASITESVSGVINVGGVVGYLSSKDEYRTTTLTNMHVAAKVYGNANVGGLVGYAKNATLTNNFVGGIEYGNEATRASGAENKEAEVFVKGIYYNYYYKTTDVDVKTANKNYVSFIPTSVGGFIGTSLNSAGISNILYGLEIISAMEGYEFGKSDNDSKGMISTISNYMAKIVVGTGSNDTIEAFEKVDETYVLTDDKAKHYLSYSDISSGFAAFIGTIDNTTENWKLSESEISKEKQPNAMSNVVIKAHLGVNVGTYYGHYVYDDTFGVPSVYGTIKVDGAYNVGGIAGKLSGSPINTLDNTLLVGKGKISLQTETTGMYVGGLIGEIISNDVQGIFIDNSASTVDIEIITANSYYIGGLVGKLKVSNPNNTFIGELKGFITKSSLEGFLHGNGGIAKEVDSAKNFGGLVGMLKAAGSKGTYFVQGIHEYAFTVNTIENQNYEDGKSQVSATEVDGNIFLETQAYYINLDSFNISAASNSDYYNKDAKNVLRTDSKGWAKEYTGFKQLQRCIPQRENNGAAWDSIAFVYNAENIIGVGTVLNTNLTTGEIVKEEEGKLYYQGDTDKVYMDDNFIIYTIYEKDYGKPILYSPLGIASAMEIQGKDVHDSSIDGKTTTDILSSTGEEEFKDNMADGSNGHTGISEYYWFKSLNDPYLAGTTDKAKIKTIAYEEISKTENLLRFNWSGHLHKIQVYEGNKNGKEVYTLDRAYYMAFENYIYDFMVIYANNTTPNDDNSLRVQADVLAPHSGSIFEISGLNPYFTISEFDDGYSSWPLVGKIFFWIGMVIAAVLAVVACIYAPALAPGVLKIGFGVTISAASIVKVCAIVVGIMAISSMISAINDTGAVISKNTYFSTKDQNLGLYANTLTSEVRYKTIDGKLTMQPNNMTSKTVVDADGMEYEYYYLSSTRPSDYYDNYYTVTISEMAPGSEINSMTEGVSINEAIKEDVNGDNKLIHSVGSNIYGFNYGETPNTEVNAYKKYIYEDGAYYYNSLAVKVGSYRTNELTNPEDLKFQGASEPLKEYEYVYAANGCLYVRGYYNSVTGYSYYDYEGINLMSNSGKNYFINGKDVTSDAIWHETTDFYYYGTNATGLNVNGYQSINNAYYTINGKSSSDDNFTRYATYTYWTEDESVVEAEVANGYTINLDYIKVSYQYVKSDNDYGNWYHNDSEYVSIEDTNNDGIIDEQDPGYNAKEKFIITHKTAYYKISSMATSDIEVYSNFNLGYQKVTGNSLPDVVKKAYPTTFKNPYHVTGLSGIKDAYYYINSKDVPEGFDIKYVLTTEIDYFYCESGYKTAKNLGIKIEDICTETLTETEKVEAQAQLDSFIYTPVRDDEQYLSQHKMTLYKSSSEKELTLKELIEDLKKGTSSTYKDWYLGELDDESKATIIENVLYKVGINYVYHSASATLYKLDGLYTLDEHGFLAKYYKYATKQDVEQYKNNKYLTNSTYGVYTLLKYVDQNKNKYSFYYSDVKNSPFLYEGEKLNEDDDMRYLLIPTTKNKSKPNRGNTYLVETCKATIGGTLRLNYTGINSLNGIPTGQIIIQGFESNE